MNFFPTKFFARAFDVFDNVPNKKRLEHLFVRLAILSFITHLTAIFVARTFPTLELVPLSKLGTNYLQAVYTPFSFILFYEVILLVLAIPKSLTTSICKQYEIISLIVIRRVFKDIGSFEDMDSWLNQPDAVKIVLLDMGGALLMFVAVTIFYRVRTCVQKSVTPEGIDEFIELKKAVALVLGGVLIALAAYNLFFWVSNTLLVASDGSAALADADQFFFPAFFEFMIFTDVLILIVSISYYDRYEYLFRNSGFVISTVLLRISLSTPKPFDLAVAVIAVLYGLALVSVFAYFTRVSARMGQLQNVEDEETED
ncbi:MAG: hypothetical protein AAFN77_05240 [Planctomycetota bacterium]